MCALLIDFFCFFFFSLIVSLTCLYSFVWRFRSVCVCVCKQNFEYKQTNNKNWKNIREIDKKICFFLFFEDEIGVWYFQYATMILLIILLSYILGCASTIALLLYLYTSYAFSPPVIANEENDQQFEPFHPLPEVS